MTKEEIQKHYEELCITPSDIFQHLPKLREYADKCDTIVEMGVRSAVSLYSFLSSKASKVVAYDIIDGYRPPAIDKLTFICADVLTIDIENVDFLFIDTAHNYKQLSQELSRHAKNVNKYIGFHDTETFGVNGDDGGEGLLKAIREFLAVNKEWEIDYHTTINNGLTIIKKQNEN